MTHYTGSCHCGAIQFSFDHPEITEGLRCNCSICRRKGAVMSAFTLWPDEIQIKVKQGALGFYQFDFKEAKHYFCKTCGIYPFHQMMPTQGSFRINLGCVDQLDTEYLQVEVYDGRSI